MTRCGVAIGNHPIYPAVEHLTGVSIFVMAKGRIWAKKGLDTPSASIKPAGATQKKQIDSKSRILKMREGGKAKRNARGAIIKAAEYASSVPEESVVRVQPDRRWFGNTRVVGQAQLDKFRAEIGAKRADPYSVLLKQSKLPMSLLTDSKKAPKGNLLQVENFGYTFGAKSQRKRPRLMVGTMEELARQANQASSDVKHLDTGQTLSQEDRPEASHPIFQKGQSKRIWNELFKVIDSSDVLVHVLDARDPFGTRCKAVETYIGAEAPHKHLVFLLNKADLIPSKVCQQWIKRLARERPTLAFHASINNSFGRGALIALLRQFAKLHPDKKQISVGFVGYPNVGKSSIINTLRQKAVCSVAPIPGQTKVWQYVTLMKRIYLIDCPGVVPAGQDEGTETEKILRGVVRVEHVECPEEHITAVIRRVLPEHLSRTYNNILVPHFETKDPSAPVTPQEQSQTEEFLGRLAQKCGKLLKGGEPDIRTIAIMVINDWLRGRIPYFTPVPRMEGDASNGDNEQEHGESDGKQQQDDELSRSTQLSEDEPSLQVNLDELEQFYSDKDDE